MDGTVEKHNERPAAVWSAGGEDYDEISRGIADSIEHCVLRLNPQPGERILDLSDRDGLDLARRRAARRHRDRRRHRRRLLDAARARPKRTGCPSSTSSGMPTAALRGRRLRRRRVHVRDHVRQPPRGRSRELARVCRPGGRDRAHDLAVGQQPVQDVRGDEALHAAAAEPRRRVTVRVGPHRAHPGAARRARSSSGSRRACPTTASRAARRPGRRSRRATVPRGRWPRPRPGATRGAARGLHCVPRGLPHGARHLCAARYWLTVGVRM